MDHRNTTYRACEWWAILVLMPIFSLVTTGTTWSQPVAQQEQEGDSLRFPLYNPQGYTPPILFPERAFDFTNPENIYDEVTYNPEDSTYTVTRKSGDQIIGIPFTMTAEEYYQYNAKKMEDEYFHQRLQALNLFNQKAKLPPLSKAGVFDRIFGGNTISVKPQGNLDLTFAGSWQNMKNPNLIQSAQKYGIFDFDMDMNVNLVAQIGTKLKLNISQNTLTTFGEQNTQKIEYTGGDNDIIRKIEAGNVSFPLKSNLLSGPVSLFGLKTQLQFGRMMVTGVISQQKSQRKSIQVKGGAMTQDYDLAIGDYDENRNFFLAQYFHDNYEKALNNIPIINSQVQIQKVEVWVTNRRGETQGVRDVLAFMDLGEKSPYKVNMTTAGGSALPDNSANRLYSLLLQSPNARRQSTSTQAAQALGLQDGTDFQRNTMRKLNESEYSFQPQLGYISLNTQVNSDDILAIAYRYTYNGKTYQVGEFAEDLPPDSSAQNVIFLKLVKGTAARPRLPIWKLMMKNVYTIGSFGNLSREDFRMNVVFEDPSGGEKRYIPEGPSAGVPIISLLNLDRLNSQNDPTPDGVFDFVEGITVNSEQGKIIFPVLEPFGSALDSAMGNDPQLIKRYLYQILYDSTKTIAEQFQQNNRFRIKGSYKGTGGSEINLGGFNIPEGSVTVTAGGQRLTEGTDYTVDYNRGAVTITNEGILNSGIPVDISFEDNASFGLMNQNFWGVRVDYYVNDHLTLGGTVMRLTERPFFEIVQAGEDPIKNTVVGLDANYQNEFPALTRALDKLPFFSTTAPSFLSLSGEVAGIFPGHQSLTNTTDPDGSVAIDDFEGANSAIDIKFPVTNWALASTPAGATDITGNELFKESATQGLANGYNRARLAWYMIDPNLVDGFSNTPASIKADTSLQDYWRVVDQKEIFSQRDLPSVQSTMSTFDLGFYPKERGPYNYVVDGVNQDGTLQNPERRWGGIQRALDNNSSDFEESNVEYVTFWLLDPYIYNRNNPNAGGFLYLNLGNVSEDVLKDGRLSFENGIPFPKDLTKLDQTDWGYVPKFQQAITRSFSNDPEARKIQDVGYDELDDDEERTFFSDFLTKIEAHVSPEVFQKLQADPSSDNYHFYRGDDYDQEGLTALQRYKMFNNPQGNSPVSDLNSKFTTSGNSLPETEDLNNDNTLNETEAYYQYRIDLRPQQMQVGQNFITDIKTTTVKLPNGRMSTENWYHFKVPIDGYDKAVGGIGDFRSIRFIRMFMTGFSDSVILRFAQLQLERNQWRRYLFSLTSPGENIPEDQQFETTFNLASVSVEENYDREPVPYRIPPGIKRQMAPGGVTGQNLMQDERSLSLQVCGLKDGDARAAFKRQVLDMRQYRHMKMFIHAEGLPDAPTLNDGDLVAFIRVGSDFVNNYYEYQIPLKVTPDGTRVPNQIWPDENQMDLYFDELIDAKNQRTNDNFPTYLPYQTTDSRGFKIIVVGQPSIGNVKNIMLGILNPKKNLTNPNDDGMAKCAEVWFDELRMAGPREHAAYAASGQADVQLADLGTVHAGGTMHTIGYGNIDQKLNERSQDEFKSYDLSTNLNVGKLMPTNWGFQIPVYAAYSRVTSDPKYNPFDNDQILSEQLRSLNPRARDSVRKAAQDFTSITSINITNMRFQGNPQKSKVPMPWSLKNFDLSYAYNRTFKRNPFIEHDELIDHRLDLGYTYSIKVKPFTPFKNLKNMKSNWLRFIKDFNINYLPSSFTFRNTLHKIFEETQVRDQEVGAFALPPTYFKDFTWERSYQVRWELTRSLNFNYTAQNISRIDEPFGRLDTKAKKDTVWNNLLHLGRNTFYTQTFNATYTVPTNKFPILDWMNINLSYSSSFNWTAASKLAADLGNTMANTQTRQINATFNFTQLYNKSRWLKGFNAPSPIRGIGGRSMNANPIDKNAKDAKSGDQQNQTKTKKEKSPSQIVPPKPKKKKITEKDVPNADSLSPKELHAAIQKLKKKERQDFRTKIRAWRKRKNSIVPEMPGAVKAVGRLATMVKRVNINYSDNSGTILPGFMDSTRFFGVNPGSRMPWYGFAFGAQPGLDWFDRMAAQNLITRDSIFNDQLHQTYNQTYNITASLEPIPDLRIELKWNHQFSKDYSENFKYDWDENTFRHLSPYSLGTFTTSFIGLKTMFTGTHANSASELFENFSNNRAIISQRLGRANPYVNGAPDPNDPNYAKGYGQYAQQVLIPAFIAAYSGNDAGTIPLITNPDNNIRSNPFHGYLPMPNWTIAYTGLSKIPALQDKIQSFTLNNGYNGTLSMNSFVSSLYYQDILGMGFPSFIDSTSNNFVPFFQVPNVTITESFSPLIGFDIAFKSGLNFSIQFNKTRTLSLSLIDYQVSEMNSTEFIVGFGHRIHGMRLPFALFGSRELKNDINIQMDFGYRNDLQTNSYLMDNMVMPTSGQKVITISPSIDYLINDNLQLKIFYDRRQSVPAMSNAYPITTTRAGVTLRFLFSQ